MVGTDGHMWSRPNKPLLLTHYNMCVNCSGFRYCVHLMASLVPRPSPSFPLLAVWISTWERAWYNFSREWRHVEGKLCELGHYVNHKQLCPHVRTRVQLFRVRWQHTKTILCCSSWDDWEDREFYQGETVKTHSNILVVLAHIQLKSFYHLSTWDVTHMRKSTRPSPA